ncbi:MAG TPA: 5-oxoprolinase subunit PxpA [Phycisphaerales bacterium]|nr:5-oxoprolinase subunit PxpA [Phycisphaerales bacterium]
MPNVIDVNCDVGEVPAMIAAGHDDALAACVSSVNIACSGHAGDELSMRRVVLAARRAGTNVGAHPGYPDRVGFGRVRIAMTADALRASVREQVARLIAVCDESGVKMTHVKPHGALYHDCRERDVAEVVGNAVQDACGHDVTLVTQAGNDTAAAVWQRMGFGVVREAFADRGYERDGTLVARGKVGAMLLPADAARQAVMIARDQCVFVAGERVRVEAQTLCVHGDGEHALATAHAVVQALRDAGISVRGLAAT